MAFGDGYDPFDRSNGLKPIQRSKKKKPAPKSARKYNPSSTPSGRAQPRQADYGKTLQNFLGSVGDFARSDSPGAGGMRGSSSAFPSFGGDPFQRNFPQGSVEPRQQRTGSGVFGGMWSPPGGNLPGGNDPFKRSLDGSMNYQFGPGGGSQGNPALFGGGMSRGNAGTSHAGKGGSKFGQRGRADISSFLATAIGGIQDALGRAQQGAGDPPGFQFGGQAPSLQDFLAQMGDGSGLFSAEFSGLANQKNDMERRRQEALAAISGSTDALAGDLTDSRGDLDARYRQAITEAAGANQQTQAQTAQLNSTAAKQNADLFNSLGIADGVDRTNSQQGEAFDLSQMAKNAQSADTEQRGRQMTAYELGTRNIDAGRMRGNELQAASNRDYGSALAELLDQESQLRSQAQQQAQQMALQMYNQAQQQFNSDRDFAYNDYVRQDNNARDDARYQLDYDMQMQQAQAEGMPQPTDQDELYQELMGLGVKNPATIDEWLRRATGRRNDLNSGNAQFNDVFGGSGPVNARLYAYLKEIGVLK